jgi:phosphoribosyl-AMP cyclohydrolase
LVTVNQIGAACHTGRRTCFYTDVVDGVETVTQAPLEG